MPDLAPTPSAAEPETAGRSLRRWMLLGAIPLAAFFLPPLLTTGEVSPCRAIASAALRTLPLENRLSLVHPAFVQRVFETQLARESRLPAPIACTLAWWRMSRR